MSSTADGTSTSGDDDDGDDGVLCVTHEKLDVGPPGCVGDEDCSAGWICLDGMCEPGDCHTNADCEGGDLCVSHVCQAGTQVSACADAVSWSAVEIDTSATWLMTDLALADVNGDGSDDAVVVEIHDPTTTIHVADGATLAVVDTSEIEMSAFRVALADVNGDAQVDVLLAGRADGQLGLARMELDAAGVLGLATPYVPDACDGAAELAAIDLDGDGERDVAVLLQGDANTMWKRGDGTGVLAPAAWLDTIPTLRRMAAADLDGDGAADLALATDRGELQLVHGGPTPEARPFAGDHALAPGDELAIADLDGDGALDLLAAGGDASYAAIDLAGGQGDVSFATPTRVLVPGGFAHGLTAADLDADGDLDLAFGAASGGVTVLRMTAGVPDCALAVPLPDRVGALATGDLNGDGVHDLAGIADTDGASTLFVVHGGG